MKKDYTHICIVLDASGSMECIENDIKGSFNTFLNKQREEKGKTVFDLFQFSSEVERLVKSADLALFKDDLMAKYTCSGCTALNDAVCTAIDTMGKEFSSPFNHRFFFFLLSCLKFCFKSKAASCWHDLLSPPQPENSLPTPGPE